LCVSVLEDAYHFALTSSPSPDVPPSIIETSVPFTLASPDSLDDTLQLLRSTFGVLNPESQTIFSYPDAIRTVHRRTIMNIVTKLGLPSLKVEPISFREAYNATLSATNLPTFILFLQCTPGESTSELIEYVSRSDGEFLEIQSGSLSVLHTATEDLAVLAEEVDDGLVKPDLDPVPTRIVILGPPSALAKAVESALTPKYPSIPVHIATPTELSKGTAMFALPSPNAARTRVTATYITVVPISIETADGRAVVIVPTGRKLRPVDESILLTTSVDNQTSVTVRIFLGNHAKAEDNLPSGTVVLEGLSPLAKGEAIIRVTLVIGHKEGATVTVEQVVDQDLGSAPRKVERFPDLIRYLGSDYQRFIVGDGLPSALYLEDSVKPVGELPE